MRVLNSTLVVNGTSGCLSCEQELLRQNTILDAQYRSRQAVFLVTGTTGVTGVTGVTGINLVRVSTEPAWLWGTVTITAAVALILFFIFVWISKSYLGKALGDAINKQEIIPSTPSVTFEVPAPTVTVDETVLDTALIPQEEIVLDTLPMPLTTVAASAAAPAVIETVSVAQMPSATITRETISTAKMPSPVRQSSSARMLDSGYVDDLSKYPVSIERISSINVPNASLRGSPVPIMTSKDYNSCCKSPCYKKTQNVAMLSRSLSAKKSCHEKKRTPSRKRCSAKSPRRGSRTRRSRRTREARPRDMMDTFLFEELGWV